MKFKKRIASVLFAILATVTLSFQGNVAHSQVAGNCTTGAGWLCPDGEIVYWDYYSCWAQIQ